MSSSNCFSSAGSWKQEFAGISRPKNGYIGDDVSMETLVRDSRRCNANRFNRQYKFLEGEKCCIGSDGRSYSWKDKCYDRIWVGVHGKESICIVTLKEDVDLTRVAPCYQTYYLNHQVMRIYAEAIVSEVECIPYNSVMVDRIENPFGVVSVIPYTVREGEGSSHEVMSAKYDKDKAVEYLKDKMKSNLAFTFDETVQTAISAFQQLCCKELKVEDIWVSTAWNIDSFTGHMHLPERQEYLDMISGASSGEGRPPKVHLSYSSMPTATGTPNASGWCEGVTLTNNLANVHVSTPYSTPRPLSPGGGCSDSDDDDDDDRNKNRGSLYLKEKHDIFTSTPVAGFGGV